MKNIISTSRRLLFLVIFVFVIYMQAFAGNFIWNGTASTDWSTSTNWTPNGVPSSNDSVTIVTGSNNVHLASNTTIKLISINSGVLDLQSYSLTVSGNATFTSGQVNNGILSMYGTATITFKGTQFGAKVYATGNSILLNGSTFNDSLSVVKKGTATDNGKGGNTFNSAVSIIDSANGILVLSDSFPDTFNSRLWLANRSTSKIYLAHRGTGNNFNGDVCFQGKNIWSNYYGTATYNGNITFDTPNGEVYFGYSTGSASLANGKNLYIGTGGFSAGYLYFRNFVQSDSTLSISLTLTGTARLVFESGSSFKASLTSSAPFLYLNGTRFLGITSITTTGSSNSTSLGGSYFAKSATIYHNPSAACTFTTGTSAPDTFASPVVIKNGIGTMSINKSLFQDSVTLKNLNSITGSDRFYIGNSGDVVFQGKIILDNALAGMNFGNSGGISTVAGTGSLSILSTFTGILTLKNFQYSSSDSVSILMNNASSKLILNSGVYFERPFSFYGRNIQLNGASFDSSVTITRYGTTGDVSSGGNAFGWNTVIKDSSSTAHNFILANSTGDTFDGNVTFIQKGSGVNIYPAYTGSTLFSGDIVVESSSGMQFGANGGFAKFISGSVQTIHRNGSGTIQFKKLEIDKKGNYVRANYVELATPITVTDSLNLFKYYLHSDSINLLTLSDNIKVTGGSDSSYIMGFVSKIGNDSFLFPLGSPELTHPYHPLGISAPANTTDAFLSVLIPAQQNYGNEMDSTIENISTCNFWNLYRTNGNSNVYPTLTWNHEDCILARPADMRVSQWNSNKWKDLGNLYYSGDSIFGSVKSNTAISTFGHFVLSNKACVTFGTVDSSKDVSCFNYHDGWARVLGYGGTAPYAYLWLDSLGLSYQLLNQAPDSFIVKTTDKHGCILYDTLIISQPDSISAYFANTASACNDSTGQSIITPSGGTMPYTYSWVLSGEEDSVETDLCAGTYTVVVGDKNGCSALFSTNIKDNDASADSIHVISNVSCYGYSDGVAQIYMLSGKDPFKYEWSNEHDVDTIASQLTAGFNWVKITDGNGCIQYDSVYISEPSAIQISFALTSPNCGQSNGSIITSVSGGISPYSYHWTISGSNEPSVGETSQGIDTLEVEDLNKCFASKIAVLTNSDGPSVSLQIINEIKCFGDTNAAIRAVVSGGTQPYSYNWFPFGIDNDTLSNIGAGDYILLVKDANGCSDSARIIVETPLRLNINTYSFAPSTDSTNDGAAGVIIEGGTPEYSYLWYPSGDTTAQVMNLSMDTTFMTVTDANGCISNATIVLNYEGCTRYSCDPYIDFSLNQVCNIQPPCSCTVGSSACCIKNLVTDFGAQGDLVSDQCAFEEAMNFFRNNLRPDAQNPNGPMRPGNGKLIIPAGEYLVGYEHSPSCNVYGKGHELMCMDSWQNFTIEGAKLHGSVATKIKYVDCLKFGSFDPVTDQRWVSYYADCGTTVTEPVPSGFVCRQLPLNCAVTGFQWMNVAAYPGCCIQAVNCYNLKIKNLELDGNSDNLVYGGGFSDGIQLPHDGIVLDHCFTATVSNVNSHHFGRDGIAISDMVCDFSPPPFGSNMDIRILNSKFNWNGRNGMSWTGGWGLFVANSEFNYNAQGRLASVTRDGLDIEWENQNTMMLSPNASFIPAGVFESCRFIHNKGYAVESSAASFNAFKKNFQFNHCTMVGAEEGSVLWPFAKKFNFNSCLIVGRTWQTYSANISQGNSLNDDQTIFRYCTFTDRYTDDGTNFKSINTNSVSECGSTICGHSVSSLPNGELHSFLFNCEFSARTLFDHCTITTNYSTIWGRFNTSSTANWDNIEMKQTIFKNNGLNCSTLNSSLCEIDLGYFFHVTFAPHGGVVFRHASVLQNPNSSCGIYTKYRSQIGLQTCSNLPISKWDINTLATCEPKYFDCNINPVTFPTACGPCSLLVQPENCSTIPNNEKYNVNADHAQLNRTIFPNPATNSIDLSDVETGQLIRIYSIAGDCIFEKKIINSHITIELETFLSGVYLIQVDNQTYGKFIKLN